MLWFPERISGRGIEQYTYGCVTQWFCITRATRGARDAPAGGRAARRAYASVLRPLALCLRANLALRRNLGSI